MAVHRVPATVLGEGLSDPASEVSAHTHGPLIGRVRAGLARFVRRLVTTKRSSSANPHPPPLPPTRLRAAGAHFRDDDAFRASAIAEARLVVVAAQAAVAAQAGGMSILDVGCGAGRLAYGLIAISAPVECYEGVDVMAPPIDWCAQAISPARPAYRFRTIDVYNERYNPGGSQVATDSALPFEGGSFDLVYAFSVFSHMLTADVRAYLRDFARLVRTGGVVMITAFIEDGVPDETVNPPGYKNIAWGGALHGVRFSRGHFEGMVADAGLRIGRFEHGAAEDGQSRLILTRSDGAGAPDDG
jgi:SAM-dependent methyltransferase